jgi:hypothetical protein
MIKQWLSNLNYVFKFKADLFIIFDESYAVFVFTTSSVRGQRTHANGNTQHRFLLLVSFTLPFF